MPRRVAPCTAAGARGCFEAERKLLPSRWGFWLWSLGLSLSVFGGRRSLGNGSSVRLAWIWCTLEGHDADKTQSWRKYSMGGGGGGSRMGADARTASCFSALGLTSGFQHGSPCTKTEPQKQIPIWHLVNPPKGQKTEQQPQA